MRVASKSLKINIEKSSGGIQLLFSGPIDENSLFPPLDFKEIKTVTLDLKEVDHLNSTGLRSWVHWMQQFPQSTKVVLKNCTKYIVYQMNILDGFVPMGAIIESVFVPYFCEACGFEKDILAQRGVDFLEASDGKPAENRVPENLDCMKCGGQMEMSFFSARYFRFLEVRGR